MEYNPNEFKLNNTAPGIQIDNAYYPWGINPRNMPEITDVIFSPTYDSVNVYFADHYKETIEVQEEVKDINASSIKMYCYYAIAKRLFGDILNQKGIDKIASLLPMFSSIEAMVNKVVQQQEDESGWSPSKHQQKTAVQRHEDESSWSPPKYQQKTVENIKPKIHKQSPKSMTKPQSKHIPSPPKHDFHSNMHTNGYDLQSQELKDLVKQFGTEGAVLHVHQNLLNILNDLGELFEAIQILIDDK